MTALLIESNCGGGSVGFSGSAGRNVDHDVLESIFWAGDNGFSHCRCRVLLRTAGFLGHVYWFGFDGCPGVSHFAGDRAASRSGRDDRCDEQRRDQRGTHFYDLHSSLPPKTGIILRCTTLHYKPPPEDVWIGCNFVPVDLSKARSGLSRRTCRVRRKWTRS